MEMKDDQDLFKLVWELNPPEACSLGSPKAAAGKHRHWHSPSTVSQGPVENILQKPLPYTHYPIILEVFTNKLTFTPTVYLDNCS